MNNSNYKGLANDEYGLYETLDNGLTWKPLGSAPVNAVFCYDRIIYGSTENLGLRYSDDGGVTLIESDHPTGNWDGINYVGEVVYAHSMDGLGIFTSTATESNGIGEIWTKVADADSDAEPIITAEGKVYYQSSSTNILTPTNSEEKPIANATINNGEIIASPVTLYDGKLLTVLNKIILPQLIARLTGSSSTETLNYFTDGVTYDGNFYNTLFSGLGVSVKGDSSNSFTETDFQNLLGMMPLKINVSDYTEQIDTTNLSLIEEANLPENDTLNKTLDLIDTILEIKKNYAEEKIGQQISNVETDMSELANLNLSSEEYANAVYTQKMFYDVQKASTISILVSMIRAVYTFNTDRKISLLKAAIYETVINTAGSINYQLNKLTEKLNTTDYKISDSDLTIDYDFSAGLRTAMDKYFTSVFNNVSYAITNNDDLKSHAAIWYRDNFRTPALKTVGNYIRSLPITFSTAMFDSIVSQYNTLIQQASEYNANRTKFISEVKQIIESTTDESLITGSWVINELESKYYPEGCEAIKNLTSKETILNALSGLPDYNTDSLKAYIKKDNIKAYMDDIYQKIYDSLKTYLNNIAYEDYYSQDDDYGDLSNEEALVLEKYCKEIIAKFKSRSLELLEVVYNSMLSNLDGDGYEYYLNYLANEIEEGKQLEEVLKTMGENIKTLIEKSWYSLKERI